MTYMLYGSFFMLGSAYTLLRGGHIRTDSLYAKWSPQTQGIVDAVCYVLFFFPPMLALLYVTWDYFWISFLRGERVIIQPLDARRLPIEICHACHMRPADAAGVGRAAALGPCRTNRRMAGAPCADAGSGEGRCLRNGLASSHC